MGSAIGVETATNIVLLSRSDAILSFFCGQDFALLLVY